MHAMGGSSGDDENDAQQRCESILILEQGDFGHLDVHSGIRLERHGRLPSIVIALHEFNYHGLNRRRQRKAAKKSEVTNALESADSRNREGRRSRALVAALIAIAYLVTRGS